jgi:maleylpyruvate isomerase
MILYGFWRSSATWRVRIGLAYKGVAFEYRPVNLQREGGGEQHEAAYRGKNPMAQVPLLETDDAHIAQSMAILEYLEERIPAPPLLPEGRAKRACVRQLAEIVNSGIQPLQNTAVRLHVQAQGLDDRAWIERWVIPGLAALEAGTRPSAGRFAVGDELSFADLCIVPELYFARRFALDLTPYPTLLRVESACSELDAFQRAHADRQPDRPAM